MDRTDPHACLDTVDALVIDGANGVCSAPVDLALPAIVLAIATVLIAITLHRRHARATIAITALAIACAIPGWIAIAADRADRPTEVASSARAVERLHGSIRRFASEHACAEVVVGDCVACQPIARLALAGLRCERPAPIELREGALTGACDERAGTLVCGAP